MARKVNGSSGQGSSGEGSADTRLLAALHGSLHAAGARSHATQGSLSLACCDCRKQPYSKRDPFKQAGDSDVIPRGQFDGECTMLVYAYMLRPVGRHAEACMHASVYDHTYSHACG